MELHGLTAHQIIEKKINPKEVRKTLETRINSVDKKIKAVLRLCPPQNIGGRLCPDGNEVGKGVRHKASSDARQSSVASALSGIPIAIKDNICVKDNLTTCASHILEGFKPPYDATVITKLRNAGADLFCSTNMDEFAFGSSTENSFYGPTHNPWDLERVPGGSSGGSAAAVAADEVIMALGSDTGGSIRQPASFCGVVGLKPTYGRVSRYGLIAFGSSLDQIGPITKDVRDNAMLLNVIAGYDPNDSTSVDVPVPDYTKSLVKDIKGLKIGIPKEYFIEGIDQEVKDAVWDAIKLLKKLGADYKEISLPHTEYAVPTYYIVATSEASSNLARFDGVQYGLRSKAAKKEISALIDMYFKTRQDGFGKEAKRRIMLGTYALSAGYYEAYYLRALKVRTLIKRDFDEAFKSVDCIITPTSPTGAFKIGEKTEDPLSMYLSDIFTISANLAGIPGISIPCGFTSLESKPLTGFTKNSLPIGLQILAKPFAEETLFRVAHTYEQNTEWHRKKPQL